MKTISFVLIGLMSGIANAAVQVPARYNVDCTSEVIEEHIKGCPRDQSGFETMCENPLTRQTLGTMKANLQVDSEKDTCGGTLEFTHTDGKVVSSDLKCKVTRHSGQGHAMFFEASAVSVKKNIIGGKPFAMQIDGGKWADSDGHTTLFPELTTPDNYQVQFDIPGRFQILGGFAFGLDSDAAMLTEQNKFTFGSCTYRN